MSKPPLGSGGRFQALVASGKSPALAAYIGRQKYGNKGMAALSAHGTAGAPDAIRLAIKAKKKR